MTIALAIFVLTSARQEYRIDTQFVESCSCKDVCVTEITGRDAGCHGLGAMHFTHGKYGGKDFSGASAAFAWDSGKWVRIFVDASGSKRAAVTEFMKAALADWGKLEPIQTASIKIFKSGKDYRLEIGGGKLGKSVISPVFGGDGKTAVTHTNLTSPLHSTLMQGATASAALLDVGHSFTLSGTNGFYNMHSVMKGRL